MFSILYKAQNRWIKLCLFCAFFLMGSKVYSQSLANLVNNPSGEQYSACPTNGGQVYYANFWYLPTGYNGSTDYFNTCATSTNVLVPSNFFGFQNPRSGNAYYGFAPFGASQVSTVQYREYLGNGLKQSLDSGKAYCVTYYVSLAEIGRVACANIGAVFTKDSLLNRTPSWPAPPIFLNPDIEATTIITDTINWTMLQGVYVAKGSERFITLGNFRMDANTFTLQVKPVPSPPNQNVAYYYIDDISVIEINSANASLRDTVFKCVADSVVLGTDSTEFALYSWQSSTGLSCTNCPNPIAKPTTTTKYYLTKQQCSSTTIDSVIVSILTPTTPARAGADRTICPNESTVLGSDSVANILYSWQPVTALSCSSCPNPTAQPDSSTTYILTRQECAFVSYDTVKIFIDDCNPTFTVPTVFTPNQDGVNDTWGVMFSSTPRIKNFAIKVYDRWGILVFSNDAYTQSGDYSTPNIRWDGRTTAGEPCTEGTYFYIINFTKNGEEQKLKGSFSLFR